MGHMGMRTSGATEVSDLLGKEMVATPTIARAVGSRRRRLELPHSIERERVAFGERAATRYLPLGIDSAMLVAASVAPRLVWRAADKTTSPVVWDALFFVLVLFGFGLRGLYRDRIQPN